MLLFAAYNKSWILFENLMYCSQMYNPLAFVFHKPCFETNGITGKQLVQLHASALPRIGIYDFQHIKVLKHKHCYSISIYQKDSCIYFNNTVCLFNVVYSKVYTVDVELFSENHRQHSRFIVSRRSLLESKRFRRAKG